MRFRPSLGLRFVSGGLYVELEIWVTYRIPWLAKVFSAGHGDLESPAAVFPRLYWGCAGCIVDAEAIAVSTNDVNDKETSIVFFSRMNKRLKCKKK